MAFSQARLTLFVRARICEGKISFHAASTTVAKYLAIDDLLDPSHHRGSHDDPPMSESSHARNAGDDGRTKEDPPYKVRNFAVESVFRTDGRRKVQTKLPTDVWTIVDIGTLEDGQPEHRWRDRAERRLVAVTLEGPKLTEQIETDCKEATALREVILEQGEIRLSISVDRRLRVPIALRLSAVIE